MALIPVSSKPSPRSGSASEEPRKPLAGRRYTFSLSFAGLLTSGIVIIIAIGWIFAFGVIVGRGINPEKQLPELAKLLPAPADNATEAKDAILKPEELTFMAELKNQTGKASSQPAPVAQAAAAKPVVQSDKPAAVSGADKTPKVQRFDFVFQAVAYKNREQADKLREKLEGEGLRTRMTIEKDSKGKPKWFRVQVLFRGNEEDAAATQKIMERFGIKAPQRISQKPVK